MEKSPFLSTLKGKMGRIFLVGAASCRDDIEAGSLSHKGDALLVKATSLATCPDKSVKALLFKQAINLFKHIQQPSCFINFNLLN
jgi:hypothetical protein